jgi:hypothetical protein
LFALTGFVPQISLDQTIREVIDYELGRLAADGTASASVPGMH